MNLFKKLGPHYAIERFGIIFCVLFVAFCLVVGSVTSKEIAYHHKQLSGNAVYSRTFTMSQTRSQCNVLGVYSNRDHTNVFVLLKFVDMSQLPTKADDYQMFLSGCNTSGRYEQLKSSPSGFLYLFGNTGYMGIYLHDVAGFPSQLVKMYLRANVMFTVARKTGYSDATFDQFNQGQFIFNPGGVYASHADFLERENWTIEDVVEEILCRTEEVKIRAALRADLKDMVQEQLLLTEYTQRVKDLNVVVPNMPAVIANDTVYALQTKKEYDGRLHYITSYGGGWVNDAGTKGFRDNEVALYLDSPYVVPGGFDFNWQDGRILTGYLEGLTGTTSLSQWLNFINSRNQGKDQADLRFEDELKAIQWKMVDGSLINLNTKVEYLTQNEKDIRSAINLLITTWKNIYSYKTKYETVDLYNLLRLESDFRNAVDAYTVNVGDNGPVLTLW